LCCSIFSVALLEESGSLKLYSFSTDKTHSSASDLSGFRAEDSILVKSIVVAIGASELTQFLSGKILSIIKLDVEGAELECLTAPEQFLQHQNPIFLVEILLVYSEDNHLGLRRQQAIEALLSR
jgi:hypothetical protein